MSDASATASRVPTLDGQQDLFDHEISLVDTTNPDATRTRTQSPGATKLSKKPTRTALKEQLAKRKYARYSYERYSKAASVATEDEAGEEEQPEAETEPPTYPDETEAVDFADRGRKSNEQKEKKHRSHAYEVDILYENQRGSFIFGMPLYSHSSLLNFDPGPWVNKDFKDSAVNITNAQVPDPTWEWTWKSWYVDMSYDVDEEGWQYSFAFGNKFAWHGTHPWFHSFVRRRRWLRKRVKRGHSEIGSGKPGSMGAAHQLTTDYFTIHPKREKSPGSRRPASYTSMTGPEVEQPPEDIKDVGSLLRALRFAAVDREKVDLVKKFINDGGEELAYLKSTIPEIMTYLVFQNSKQQLLSYLKQTANEAKEHRDQHDADERPEGEAERRRIDNLLAAVDAADQEIRGLEYWSDRKHVLRETESESQAIQTISTIFDAPAPKPEVQDNPVDEIKGISSKAEVDVDPTHQVVHDTHEQQHSPGQSVDKGKGKEREKENGEHDEASSPPRLKTDQILIQD